MKFICPAYPSLTFYVGRESYQFQAGIFNLEDYPEEVREGIALALSKCHPSSGVMKEEEYELQYKCDFCDKRFQTQAAKNGHKPFHRSEADIKDASWREGGAPPKES